MKIWIFLILLAWQGEGRTQVLVSGFDDVLRQAENTSLWRAALKLSQEDKPYAGMSKLYQLMLKRSGAKEFVLLSGMPTFFDGRVRDFMLENRFPTADYRLRNIFTQWSTVNFKMKQMEEIAKKFPQQQFVLVMDNSDTSIDWARALKEKYGNRILRLYQRQTVLKPVPEGVIPFHTTLELAQKELFSGAISTPDMDELIKELENENDEEKIIPSYAYCPVTYNPCLTDRIQGCSQFSYRVRSICRQRASLKKDK